MDEWCVVKGKALPADGSAFQKPTSPFDDGVDTKGGEVDWLAEEDLVGLAQSGLYGEFDVPFDSCPDSLPLALGLRSQYLPVKRGRSKNAQYR